MQWRPSAEGVAQRLAHESLKFSRELDGLRRVIIRENASGESILPLSRLLPHQREGLAWMLALHRAQCSGILADEMGLGKTVQVACFLAALAERGTFGTHLIVAPLSTLENWRRELQRWVPWMQVCVCHGDAATRARERARIRQRYRTAVERGDKLAEAWESGATVPSMAAYIGGVVLTNFDGVMADGGALTRCIPWDVLVVDEAHRLKNTDCKLMATLSAKVSCQMRLVLTGTPVQNNLRELWSLLTFVSPQLYAITPEEHEVVSAIFDADHHHAIGQKRLRQSSSRGAEASEPFDVDDDGDDCISRETDGGHVDAACGETPSTTSAYVKVLRDIHVALRPFMLRRTKETAGIKLPPKLDLVLYVPLTPPQRYFCRIVQTSDKYSTSRQMHGRKCALHPYIFNEFYPFIKDGDDVGDGAKLGEKGSAAALRLRLRLQQFLGCSGKLALLDQLLPRLRARGHRVLIFSQMTVALDIIEEYLLMKGRLAEIEAGENSDTIEPPLTYLRLDGSVKKTDRDDIIEKFQRGAMNSRKDTLSPDAVESDVSGDTDDNLEKTPPLARDGRQFLSNLSLNCVSPSSSLRKDVNASSNVPSSSPNPSDTFAFLISTRAGGSGLNLVQADTVILFDGDFNPQNDRQAIDRCHRIGQTSPVAVYRLFAPGTVEDAQMAALRRKMRLEEAVLCGTPEAAKRGGKRSTKTKAHAETVSQGGHDERIHDMHTLYKNGRTSALQRGSVSADEDLSDAVAFSAADLDVLTDRKLLQRLIDS